jgi:biotin/methionine sulfoxide reductase
VGCPGCVRWDIGRSNGPRPSAGEAKDDYAIFAALEERLDLDRSFTEGRSVRQWLRHLYSGWREVLAERGHALPSFDEF